MADCPEETLSHVKLPHQLAQVRGHLRKGMRGSLGGAGAFGRGLRRSGHAQYIFRDFARSLGGFVHIPPDFVRGRRLLLDG